MLSFVYSRYIEYLITKMTTNIIALFLFLSNEVIYLNFLNIIWQTNKDPLKTPFF